MEEAEAFPAEVTEVAVAEGSKNFRHNRNFLTAKEKRYKIQSARNCTFVCESGGMADAQVSGTCGRNTVWVQLPSFAPERGDKQKNDADRTML